MKASLILAHPYDKSFNHAIYNRVSSKLYELGVEVYKHDLYKEGFDPLLTVSELSKEPSKDILVNQYVF